MRATRERTLGSRGGGGAFRMLLLAFCSYHGTKRWGSPDSMFSHLCLTPLVGGFAEQVSCAPPCYYAGLWSCTQCSTSGEVHQKAHSALRLPRKRRRRKKEEKEKTKKKRRRKKDEKEKTKEESKLLTRGCGCQGSSIAECETDSRRPEVLSPLPKKRFATAA